ncbi:MAG: sensor of ECF-type sigma factor [Aequorivita sp.]|nr:sensor of ECF-type sigma factor [Aequorivita sp.]|tara:strand:+ start:163 stop:606 length:444 start_codon:yes stop_codon:yes gene_type:complete
MKRILVLFLFISCSLFAQSDKHEKIKALKTAFITEELALTPAEAEKFWPIYNRFHDKFHDLRVREKTEIYQFLREGLNELTQAEANNLINLYLEIESSQVNLRKQMTAELREVISPKKIISLKKAEDDFKRELFKRYRQHHGKKDKK